MTAKIEYARAAAGVFINHLHREGMDRGMIATFGNSYRVEQSFTSTELYLHSALAGNKLSPKEIQRHNEATRLYESIEDCIIEFYRNGKRDRPWLLTVITDGQDYWENGKYHKNPAGIGRYIATHFNHDPTNFIVVIGVGEGNEIDKTALATMAKYGGFSAATLEAFPLLEMMFLRIALHVSSRISGINVDMGNISWTQVQHIRQLSHVAIDYGFLLDRSGSMSRIG